MADPKFERNIQLGLLDRLLDAEPENTREAPMTRAESLRLFRQAVKRDLEFLLNTVQLPLEIPEGCPEARKSILKFGLPDVSSMSVQSPEDEQTLLASIQAAIEFFEPRLARARVTNKDAFNSTRQSITFHVEAMLMIDPAPERIAFDTVLEISKGAYSVKDN